METEIKKQRIRQLVDELNRASKAYYGGQDEKMSNFEWDAMFDELSGLEKETGYVLAESPTQNTGYEESGSGEREAHEYPALSLAKTKKIEELQKWAQEKEVWLTWKLDGLTLVLTYDNGALSKILTRGNGVTGTNITFLKNSIQGIPVTINYRGHLVVRGEATISYTDFHLLNDMIEDDDEKYANPRNLASGTLSLDDAEKVKERRVGFHAFTLVAIDDRINSWGGQMEFLQKEKFGVVEHEKLYADELEEAVARWTKKVESGEMDLPVDGLVICYEDTEYAAGGSVTGHHAARAGLAFKWEDVSAETTLKYVEWSCAASTISPVAVFEPVQLEGTTVSRASLCNISEMERLGIGKEATLKVIKANKIIPKCVEVTQSSGEMEIPEECPVCHAKTQIRISKTSGTKTLHCTNPECIAKHVKKFTRFVSKGGMDIDGLSVQTILKFMNLGFLTQYEDFYHLNTHFEQIAELDGFGEKSCKNLGTAIEKSRQVKAVNLIFALNIPLIGLDAAKKIIAQTGFDGFLDRMESGTGFEDVGGIGAEKSNSILSWYQTEKNKTSLSALLREVQVTDGEISTVRQAPLAGFTFVITGDLHTYKNRTELKEWIESQGGKCTGSVTKKTSFLINNDILSESGKNKKAKELGIEIISEEEFRNRFGV
ncbi:MAG: NAD-dependent DNA ligase LigA [Eubacterium sp.]|nr:NAD-dependent DNA ligase LigA [Eubacterium sp.]